LVDSGNPNQAIGYFVTETNAPFSFLSSRRSDFFTFDTRLLFSSSQKLNARQRMVLFFSLFLRLERVIYLFHRLEHPYKIQTSQFLDVSLRPATRKQFRKELWILADILQTRWCPEAENLWWDLIEIRRWDCAMWSIKIKSQ